MSTRDRVKSFLSPQTEYEKNLLALYTKEGSPSRIQSAGIFSAKNNIFREISLMQSDPIIMSALALVMETAFQPTTDEGVFKLSSPYSKVVSELNAFHDDFNFDEVLLTIAFNLLLYGNLPIQHFYNSKMQYERFEYIPDFRAVTPIVLSNRNVGYMAGSTYRYPYEFTYAQYLYFKDLGGVSTRGTQARQVTDKDKRLVNGFSLAPSYLTQAVRPWRSIKVVEDALLLQRMDMSSFMRIIGVKVGENVFTKNAVRLLNFYREILKKVRRISFDGDGMSATSFGNEFDVVLPMTDSQGLDIKEIGGQVDVRALRDLDILYKKLFSALRLQPSFIGFSDTAPSSLGESTAVNNWDERFGRLVKVLRLSAVKAVKEIDKLFLRSKGFDVNERDFTYTFVAASSVEDEKRRNSLVENVKALGEVLSVLESTKVPFNREYLVKEYFGQAFSSTAVDLDRLFNVEPEKRTIQASDKSIIGLELADTRVLVSSGLLKEDEVKSMKTILSGKKVPQEPILSYQKYLALGDSLSSGRIVNLGPMVIQRTIDKLRAVSSVTDTMVPPVTKVFSDKEEYPADLLSSGRLSQIEALYLVDDGYYLEGQDLFNYLAMVDQGVEKIPVKRVLTYKDT